MSIQDCLKSAMLEWQDIDEAAQVLGARAAGPGYAAFGRAEMKAKQ